jgi:general secretion pathway protein J
MNRLRDGFTLLEVLAVLAVLGLILAALASGVRFGATALQAQARDSSAAEQIGPVDTLLRTLIARAWPDSGEADARFAGTERSLSFRTEMPRRLAAAKRIRDADVTIGVDATHRLYLAWTPWYRHWLVAPPAAERIGLLDSVERVEFAYWDPTLKLPPGGWVTAWVGPSAPKLLRVRLVFSKDSGLRWPDLIIATARDPFVF